MVWIWALFALLESLVNWILDLGWRQLLRFAPMVAEKVPTLFLFIRVKKGPLPFDFDLDFIFTLHPYL